MSEESWIVWEVSYPQQKSQDADKTMEIGLA